MQCQNESKIKNISNAQFSYNLPMSFVIIIINICPKENLDYKNWKDT